MTTNIQIENLKCGGCASTIKKGISSLQGVQEVTVDVENSIVTIDSENADLVEIKEKLSKLGYPEVGDKNTVLHKAKSFVSCAVGRMDS
ncbi:MAG: heavy-metal-associated domain-containing protein [Flavobacteriia bacterium]|nr:heavy-metal-associated domain-containing protein [Flavobacteriia bacterium]OIP47943.1 MAG: heavy metal transporter [Flavobacteriaceae bacterium CG2_30_31_66]PIV97291.1 MAG: heavy metal transporter [Flavobacteriaceae bacterium CG17_big_fil_post_rev_8_21_14_2_50_31_13]PIX12245.1 MAG: heavy metal transporter [Flavobacteriaceae bacterium CG_4_8_14_3_um_filter_31_8]PIY15470.1 MAG: heavy metal transporter [Flavobacteriaceae bacterium CG_4_10_14_3_um_filter_31_253]PIZ12360.1 MAG: heavy metal trans